MFRINTRKSLGLTAGVPLTDEITRSGILSEKFGIG